VRLAPLITAFTVAAIALSACGDAFTPPAAAVNGVRISQDALQHQLDLLLANPQFAGQVSGSGGAERKKDLTRRLLAYLIQLELIQAYARDHGITVSSGEIQRSLSQIVAQQGGVSRFQSALRQRHLTVADVRENVRTSLLQSKVSDDVARARYGSGATDQQKNGAFQAWLGGAVRRANVEVNPRFGKFDPSHATICAIDSTAATTTCPAA